MCNKGYKLQGNLLRFCTVPDKKMQYGGKWSGEVPQCVQGIIGATSQWGENVIIQACSHYFRKEGLMDQSRLQYYYSLLLLSLSIGIFNLARIISCKCSVINF